MNGVRKTRSDWAALASKFEKSGQKPAAFCKKHGLSATTFKWWRWRLQSEARRAGARHDIRLLAVDVKPSAIPAPVTDASVVRITMGDLEIEFDVGTDVGYVSVLIEKLRSRC
jgi:hypothetical protein